MYYDQKESGKRIAKLRKLHGYTQIELAEKVGIQENTLSRIESGIRLSLLILQSNYASV